MPETQAPEDIWTVQRALNWTVEFLSKKGDEHPRLSAEWLLAHATKLSRLEVYAYFDKPLSLPERDILRNAVKRRAAGEPLQYVSGETAFRHVIIQAKPGVLIPRPETELLVDLAADKLREFGKDTTQPFRVLEVGTGTACIALSFLHEYEQCELVATDISPVALELAQENARRLQLENRSKFILCDLVEGLDDSNIASFDLLISNPPYIPHAVLENLPAEVRDFEPHLALDGGEDGLDLFRRLLHEASPYLKEGGIFAVELHETTLVDARELSLEYYEHIEIHQDLTGRNRFLTARKAICSHSA